MTTTAAFERRRGHSRSHSVPVAVAAELAAEARLALEAGTSEDLPSLSRAASEQKGNRSASVSLGRKSGLAFLKGLDLPHIDRAAERVNSFRGFALQAGASVLGYRSTGELDLEPTNDSGLASWLGHVSMGPLAGVSLVVGR